MNGRVASIAALLALGVIVISGVTLLDVDIPTRDADQTPTGISPTRSTGGGSSATQSGEIFLFLQFNASTKTLTVEVITDVYGYEDLQYEDARLCAYDENGTVLGSAPLGRIESIGGSRQYREETITLAMETRPEYVTAYHPNFSDDPRISSEVRFWVENQNVSTVRLAPLADVQTAFEFPQTDESGTCGVIEDD